MPKHRPRRIPRRSVRQRTAVALAGGALAVLPALTTGGVATPVAAPAADRSAAPQNQAAPWSPPEVVNPNIAVDGSLPQPPLPTPLVAPGAHASNGSFAPAGALGIPGSMLKAYKNAADILARELPGCHIDWALIASIGRIESNHARGGYINAAGDTLEPILGPILNGNGFAAIPDTDHGAYDGNTQWDRAVGPTQFIPSTWKGYASDGNGDGISNPSNIYDATLATGRYLCSGGLDLTSIATQRVAVYRYNHSQTYVDTVINWATAYRGGVTTLPDSTIPIGAPADTPDTVFTPDPAPGVAPLPDAPVPGTPETPVPPTTTPPDTTTPGSTTPPVTTPPVTTPVTTPPTTPPVTTPPTTPPATTPPATTPPATTPPSTTPPTTPASTTAAETPPTSTTSTG